MLNCSLSRNQIVLNNKNRNIKEIFKENVQTYGDKNRFTSILKQQAIFHLVNNHQ